MRGTQAAVILNTHSGGGRAHSRWLKVEPALRREFSLQVIALQPEWEVKLYEEIKRGVRLFIAAGGDGTVHALINALVRYSGPISLAEISIGAVALGSSNDFHKPIQSKISDVPVMIDHHHSKLRDIALASITHGKNGQVERAFLVSSSVGLVAEANRFFNTHGKIITLLKSRWTDGAILFAALKTIFSYRNSVVKLSGAGEDRRSKLTSFHVMKTQYLSGSFRFDQPTEGSDRKLRVYLMEDMTLFETLKTLVDLAVGKFMNGKKSPNRKTWLTDSWTVSSDHVLPLELDGELYEFNQVQFSLHAKQIKVCG